MKPKDKIANLLKSDKTLTESNQEKAEVLNSFFASVFTEEKDNISNFPQRTSEKLLTLEISTKDMEDKLKTLNPTKSEGPDGLHPRILKELAHELSYPLKILFDKSIKDNKIPTAWKQAEIRPIFKKGDKSNPGNYRPSKAGFGSGGPASELLCACSSHRLHQWSHHAAVDAPRAPGLQAGWPQWPFTRLPGSAATSKTCGARGTAPRHVTHNFNTTKKKRNVPMGFARNINITSGVPQGSVLGPTLFVYFINDMPDIVSSSIKIFADDTKIYSGVKDDQGSLMLQESLDKLTEWTDKWQIKFNSAKCNVLHIGRENPNRDYSMKETRLNTSTVEKDLGVYVDNNLNFEEHITTTNKKANKLMGMVSHYITHKSPAVIVPLFKSLIRPILEYGNTIWYPKLRKHVDSLENVQRRYTKRIIGLGIQDYESRLRKLRLPSLEYKRARGDMIASH
ncbi:hypothetical protein ACOMHN_063466 [Nucella lapillus]